MPNKVPQLLDPKLVSATGSGIGISITYFYNIFSKEVKSQKKLIGLQQEQKEQVVINQKFNRELVHRLTGLNGDEITEFINFCDLSHMFLFNATDYEIVEVIHDKLEEYHASKLKTP
jgi:hypothetical protein